jgi:hypothetical protein
MSLSLAGAIFTPGRIGVVLLFFPALFAMCKRDRRLLLSDLFVGATAAWMIGAAVYTSGLGALASAAGGESLEFLGSYLVARAFFFGPAALASLIRVLKLLAIVVIILACADSISGRMIVHDTLSSIFGGSPTGAGYRMNIVRAASTFEHPILFGSFCSLVAAILLYWEHSVRRRILSVGFCFIGCILSLTSVALLSILIVLAIYAYDRAMRQHTWRWSALSIVLAVLFSAVCLVANHPIGWLITHLTLDPESGWFRLMIWDRALVYIAQAPLAGYAFNLLKDEILDTTIDSVWLVCSLRFGVPMIIFLFLANLAAFLPTSTSKNLPTSTSKSRAHDIQRDQMGTAFTIVLVMFMFIGLTVHFWNFLWMFWGLCIGIRASLREQSIPLRVGVAAPIRVLGTTFMPHQTKIPYSSRSSVSTD